MLPDKLSMLEHLEQVKTFKNAAHAQTQIICSETVGIESRRVYCSAKARFNFSAILDVQDVLLKAADQDWRLCCKVPNRPHHPCALCVEKDARKCAASEVREVHDFKVSWHHLFRSLHRELANFKMMTNMCRR